MRMGTGLTVREVARRAGIPHPYISEIENGVRVPTLRQAESIARVLREEP
jgi:transcriptional regulator with XRE-family HTH domain